MGVLRSAGPDSVAEASSLLTDLFDRLAVGVCLIDRDHTVLLVNNAFRAAANPEQFRIEDGRLRLCAPYQRLFEDRVARAFEGEAVRPLPLGEQQGDLAAVLHGLGAEAAPGAPAAVAVALLDLRRGAPEAQWVSALYDLTTAETRVLQGIAAGGSVEQTAEALAISVSTVRTHLHRIFSKTRTGTQAALVRLAHLLPLD